MNIKNFKNKLVWAMVICFILSSCLPAMGLQTKNDTNDLIKSANNKNNIFSDPEVMVLDLYFSDPVIEEHGEYINVYVGESDFYHIADGTPVLPVKLVLQEFTFGTEIISVGYEISSSTTIPITKKLSFGKISPRGTDMDEDIYESSNLYPSDWISYHTGGGLSFGNHKTFLSIRIYPVRYSPLNDEIQHIDQITLTITYQEPGQAILNENSEYELLILAPSQFNSQIQKLVTHKNNMGVNTISVGLSEVYDQMSSQGRDEPEKIKYYIKNAIETWGIKYVLLMGGRIGQSFSWYLPVRYSHVVPPDEQEYAEESFISDLYYADIYDSTGGFSSWDSNDNDIFAEWDETYKEEMDLYPDVYVGRLACRYSFEVSTMVNKIINYEKEECDENWFKKLVLVAGDAYDDPDHFNEGELIAEEAINKMSDFTPVRLYAAEGQDINKASVKQVIDPGCGFAYFPGHGSPMTWATHFPPDGTEWTTGFGIFDMSSLNNKEKLPIVVVGGCHNSQFDVTILNLFYDFKNARRYGTWAPRCWAWWLTCKINGGAIATIADTGLGTHGREDTDHNDIADYLEVLDGWLELRFLELYGLEDGDMLGGNHGETLTGYLHIFLGSGEKMDAKMVQQWILFGDPSLKIGGYE